VGTKIRIGINAKIFGHDTVSGKQDSEELRGDNWPLEQGQCQFVKKLR